MHEVPAVRDMHRGKARSEQDMTDFMRRIPSSGTRGDRAGRPVLRMAATAQQSILGKRIDVKDQDVTCRHRGAEPLQLMELAVIQFPLAILIDLLKKLLLIGGQADGLAGGELDLDAVLAEDRFGIGEAPVERHVRQRNRPKMEPHPVGEGIEAPIELLNGLLPDHPVIDERPAGLLKLFDDSLGFFAVDPVGAVIGVARRVGHGIAEVQQRHLYEVHGPTRRTGVQRGTVRRDLIESVARLEARRGEGHGVSPFLCPLFQQRLLAETRGAGVEEWLARLAHGEFDRSSPAGKLKIALTAHPSTIRPV